MSSAITVAKVLLDGGVVNFRPEEPFRYTSGILSPVYMDHRVLISQPELRKKISLELEAMLKEHFRQVDTIAGTATAGIPWAAWLAARLNIPMVYVRDRAKRHGQKNQIEGILDPGARTIVIEDIISTGGSALGAVHGVQRAGAQPLAVLAINTYGMDTAVKAFQKDQVVLHTLTNFSAIAEVALQRGLLTSESHEKVMQWAADPAGWGQKMEYA